MNTLLVKLAFVMLVSSPVEEKQANILISSIREFGGIYADSPVYVFMSDTISAPCHSIRHSGITKIPLNTEGFPDYPFLGKVLTCAEVEKLLHGKAEFIVWMDTDCLMLNEPSGFYPGKGMKIAIRSVYLRNNVGLPADDAPDLYWKKIYELTHLKAAKVPVVRTLVDTVKVKAYFNCAIFSVRADLGILNEWKKLFLILLNDQEFQARACTSDNQKIFLHQAVLSAVISSEIRESKVHWFSMKTGYPLHHHRQLPHNKRAPGLEYLESLIYDDLWNVPNWILCTIHAGEPLKLWLQENYERYTGKGLYIL